MPKLAQASGTSQVVDVQIRLAAQRLDGLLQNFFGFRRALRRHHDFGVLGGQLWSDTKRRNYQNSCRQRASGYPQRTEPPLTLITSPVMKVARSDAAKRIGPAISSAVAGRFKAMGATAALISAFFRSTDADISVSTQPGATQFTRILCGASSEANPFTRLIMAPLLAP